MNKLNLVLIGLCISLAAHAQRPLRWEASAVQTAQVTFDCTRGETLTFTPYIKAYGTTLTNYTASLQWQTNGMGTSFWSTNALVFAPSMDCGANRYRFFIRAESSNGVMYSAQGTINMLQGPGAIVNALPLPVQQIDFAAVAYANAPWLLPDSAYSTTVSRASSAFGWGNHASAGYLHQGESLFISEPGGGVLFSSGEDAYALWLSYSGFRDSNDFFINLPPFSNISQTIATREWILNYQSTNSPAAAVSVASGPINYFAEAPNVEEHLKGIDIALASAGGGLPAVWTNMVWGAAGTNATYRMYWDITNGTFAVEEIIP